jgi:hypothetical protein
MAHAKNNFPKEDSDLNFEAQLTLTNFDGQSARAAYKIDA